MSDNLHYIDGRLVIWGERWDWSPQNAKPRIAKKSKLGATLVAIAMRRPAPAPITPAAVRKTLHGFARKTTPVLVKISGGGKGLAHIAAHMAYICRDGKLPLEDEEGNDHAGKDAVEDLRDLWGYGQSPIPEESQYREAINIILSMPDGTDEKAVRDAARAFAQAQFWHNHQYAMVQHTFDIDPDPNPSRNPHVHLIVKVRGRDGTRLNPRKSDLWEWRESFARELQERGVNAVATRRRQQFKRFKGESQAVRGIKDRTTNQGGPRPRREASAKTQPKAASRARKNVLDAFRDYHEIVTVLANSPAAEDNKLAVDLTQRLAEITREPALRQEVAHVAGRER